MYGGKRPNTKGCVRNVTKLMIVEAEWVGPLGASLAKQTRNRRPPPGEPPVLSVAGILGFEPKLTDPKSVVLPLHHIPRWHCFTSSFRECRHPNVHDPRRLKPNGEPEYRHERRRWSTGEGTSAQVRSIEVAVHSVQRAPLAPAPPSGPRRPAAGASGPRRENRSALRAGLRYASHP